MTDARIVRTRAALSKAIIALATEKSVTSITVSELAAAAGINRVTFYKHFTTPGEALAYALSGPFDAIRARFLHEYSVLEQEPAEIFANSIRAIIEQIDEHRAIYQLAIESPQDGTVPNLLADHFAETISQYLELRSGLQPPLPPMNMTLVSRFYAHGLVGAIIARAFEGWNDSDAFLDSVMAFVPGWWYPAAR